MCVLCACVYAVCRCPQSLEAGSTRARVTGSHEPTNMGFRTKSEFSGRAGNALNFYH